MPRLTNFSKTCNAMSLELFKDVECLVSELFKDVECLVSEPFKDVACRVSTFPNKPNALRLFPLHATCSYQYFPSYRLLCANIRQNLCPNLDCNE